MSEDIILDEWFEKIDRDSVFLVGCFRDMLEEVGEAGLAARLPWVGHRPLPEEEATLENVEREMQALSIAFHLLNLVEENAAAQARRARETRVGLLHEPGGWGQNLRQLRESGFSEADLAGYLRKVHVEVVLTAHPTEAKRPIVLRQHRELLAALEELENPIWTPREREVIRERIKLILERLWRTGEMYLHKPDVAQELEHILDFFRMVFPQVLPKLDQKLREAWVEAGFDPQPLHDPANLPRLSFGNWVGGDRDGHPLVTAEVTRQTLQGLRQAALENLQRQLTPLFDTLSISQLFQAPPRSLLEDLEAKSRAMPEAADAMLQRTRQEPWRRYVGMILARLRATEAGARQGYGGPAELEQELALLAQSLREVGAGRIAAAEVAPIQRSLRAFGFHTAALDIRQNSQFHEEALQELLLAAGLDAAAYATMEEAARRAFLSRELMTARPLAPRRVTLGAKAQAVVDSYQVVYDHIHQFGPAGIGAFIVSMTRDLSDLLTVYVLAREVGLVHPASRGLVCDVPLVPLFETVDDLQRAPEILREFLEHPITRRSVQCGGELLQQVMVGYSDSNKGSGTLASFWHLHRAQRALAGIGASRGVHVYFFHGRGGTPSRGAGPTHRFLESLPPRTVRGRFRVTEQGETIAQKYGNAHTAKYNLELLLAGVTATTVRHEHAHEDDPDFLRVGHRLSELSREAYRALLDSEGLLEFWSQATPIDAMEQSFIGSRPTRRTGQRSIEDLRAIPWVFSWSQARYYLTGWYGVGAALERLREEDGAGFGHLKARLHQWRFMRYVIYNAETAHSSADRDLMRTYADLVEDAVIRDRILKQILDEYHRTEHMINDLFGAARRERRPRMVKTVGMRSEGLRALHLRQIMLLRRWRRLLSEDRIQEAEDLFPALLLSINAIASGQRTTG